MDIAGIQEVKLVFFFQFTTVSFFQLSIHFRNKEKWLFICYVHVARELSKCGD